MCRLLARIKQTLGDTVQEVKECKMSEIRSLRKINWLVEFDQCQLVERVICELVEMMADVQRNKDEKSFILYTTMAIEASFGRKCNI